MSNDDASQTESGQERAELDASLKVDRRSISDDEADFAAQMGFGDAGSDGAAFQAQDTPVPSVAPLEAAPLDDSAADADAPDASPAGEETEPDDDSDVSVEAEANTRSDADDDERSVRTAADAAPDEQESSDEAAPAAEASESSTGEWEEIHPRAVADGMQCELQERADDVMGLAAPPGLPSAASAGLSAAESNDAASATRALLSKVESRAESLSARLSERETELERLRGSLAADLASQSKIEKQLDALHAECETLAAERDELLDQLAASSGRLVQSQARAEKLEVSLRAARGALTPLPEGERALRAEVIGLRGRLEESGEENLRLTGLLGVSATDLAIANARVEDRQHEVDVQLERIEALENAVALIREELEQTEYRKREALALSTRLQAENNELRSAQAALEETLAARDLEIVAREEHLCVTRDGLITRDRQLVDANEQLEQEHHQVASLEAELERRRIDAEQLAEKVARRESRIAALTQTLAGIEDVMGRRAAPQGHDTDKTSDALDSSADRITDQGTGNSTGKAAEKSTAESSQDEAPPRASSGLAAAGTAASTLPPVFRRWRDRALCELLEGDGPMSMADFFAQMLCRRPGARDSTPLRVHSLAGRFLDSETRLLNALRENGVDDARIEVLDCDPIRAQARRQQVERAGLAECIEIVEGGLDAWPADAPCDAILSSDALYGQTNPGRVLDLFEPAVSRGACLLFADRIAGGPLQLSASTLERLEELWALLPESLTSREGFARAPFPGDDGGTIAAAHAPLGSLLDRFEPVVVAGFGHLADLVVGPARGPALSENDSAADQLLRSIMAIDESRSITEGLPPRHAVAVFAGDPSDVPERLGQAWSPPADD